MTGKKNRPNYSPRGENLSPKEKLIVDIKKKIAEHEQDACCGLRSQRSFAITDTLEAMLNAIMEPDENIFENFQKNHQSAFDLAMQPTGWFFKDNSIFKLRERFAVYGAPSPALSRGPSLTDRAN